MLICLSHVLLACCCLSAYAFAVAVEMRAVSEYCESVVIVGFLVNPNGLEVNPFLSVILQGP